MMTIRIVLLLSLGLVVSSTTEAQVHRSDTGLGGALILPYWTVANDNDTLLSIRNENQEASVAKVRILDDEGVLLQSFNMIHRPLERYENEEAGFVIDLPPTISIRGRDGTLPPPSDYCFPMPPSEWVPPCGEDNVYPLDRALVHQNLAFNAEVDDVGEVIESAILGHPTVVRPGFVVGGSQSSEFNEGSAEFRFNDSGDDVELLIASDGTMFSGEPVISFAIQQYTNGVLPHAEVENVLANYRGTELPRVVLHLERPD